MGCSSAHCSKSHFRVSDLHVSLHFPSQQDVCAHMAHWCITCLVTGALLLCMAGYEKDMVGCRISHHVLYRADPLQENLHYLHFWRRLRIFCASGQVFKKKGKSGRCDDIKIYPLTEMKVAKSQIGRSSGGGGMDSWRQRERDRDGKDNERNEQK